MVAKKEHKSFIESVYRVAEIFGIDITNMQIIARTNNALKNTKQWIDMMRRMVDNKEVQEYDISELGEIYPINSYRQFNIDTLQYFGIKFCKRNKRVIIPIYQNKILVGVVMRKLQHILLNG